MSPLSRPVRPEEVSSARALHLDLRARLRGSFSFFVRNGLGDRRFPADRLERAAAAASRGEEVEKALASLHEMWLDFVLRGRKPAALAWVA